MMINKETSQNVCVNINRLILALGAKVAKNVQSVPLFVNYTLDLKTQIWVFEVFSMSGRADDENKEKMLYPILLYDMRLSVQWLIKTLSITSKCSWLEMEDI